MLTRAERERFAGLTCVDALLDQPYDWASGQYAPRHIRNEHCDAAREAGAASACPMRPNLGLSDRDKVPIREVVASFLGGAL
jgi:hypothetical protein